MGGEELSKQAKDLVVPELEKAVGSTKPPIEASWRKEDMEALKKYYPVVSDSKLAEHFGKTKAQVRYAAEKLGLKKGSGSSQEEVG